MKEPMANPEPTFPMVVYAAVDLFCYRNGTESGRNVCRGFDRTEIVPKAISHSIAYLLIDEPLRVSRRNHS